MKHFFSSLCLAATLLTGASTAQAQTSQLTFSQDIAPLIYTHCTPCHRPGEVAPFPLTNYTEVASHAQTIKYATGTRYMPPWKPDPNYRHFLDENTLTAAEIQRISDWVDAGTPQGNPAQTPPTPTYPSGSQLGTPDLVVPMQHAYTHQGNGQDVYRIFVLPVNLPADRDIAAVEFRAGNKSIVHHAIIGMDTTQQAQALDAADPGYGYTQFGGFGFDPVETNFAGWVPGSTSRFFPAGMGKKLYRRASILVQIHYGPNYVTQTDSSVVNIFYSRQPVTRYVQTQPAINPVFLTNGPFVIPANQVRTFHATLNVPLDASVLSVLPHSHLLAKRWKVWAVKPNGDTIRMIKINDWNFRWQGSYRFPQILKVPAGSRLEADITYDNTSANPTNPNSPPRAVSWGESTTDEMVLAYFDILPYRIGDENLALGTAPSVAPSVVQTELAIYPNPVGAGAATASFRLPEGGTAALTLLNELGEQVRLLSPAKAYPTGTHQVPISLAGLAPGFYLLRIETAAGGSQTQKLVIQ